MIDFRLQSTKDVPLAEMERIAASLAGAKKPLLVHCAQGADRTGLVVALYAFTHGQNAQAAAGHQNALYGHLPLLRPAVAAMDRSFRAFVDAHPR